ncbi:hypothetical protein Ancab_031088 [Ancistrocladus abbreviatus]
MARKNTSSSSSPSPISIAATFFSCIVELFSERRNQKEIEIEFSAFVTVDSSFMTVVEEGNKKACGDSIHLRSSFNGIPRESKLTSSFLDCQFLLINPKDADNGCKSLLKEVLNLYMKELPAMNYAANTRKESTFLERCVLNGKFCTLLLRRKSVEDTGEVIAAVTYQIIPADTQYAEIPLAAVNSINQLQGIGRILYLELKRRLWDVGVCAILCWGDKESEGFWHKQGFMSIAEVDTKGRARRLPIKPDVRRALCFPGGSTLMISHLKSNLQDTPKNDVKLCLPLGSCERQILNGDEIHCLQHNGESTEPLTTRSQTFAGAENLQQEAHGGFHRCKFRAMLCSNLAVSLPSMKFIREVKVVSSPVNDSTQNHQYPMTCEKVNLDMATDLGSFEPGSETLFSTYEQSMKRRTWEPSVSSLKSKRVKASHRADHPSHAGSTLHVESGKQDNHCDAGSSVSFREKSLQEVKAVESPKAASVPTDVEAYKVTASKESQSSKKTFNVMLMDIDDGAKKTQLTKIIEDLGGVVTANGSLTTHVLTGKVRRTLNFCTALCSGSSLDTLTKLAESKFPRRQICRIDLKEAVLRARKCSRALLKGYNICLSPHVRPPLSTLAAIVRAAGGNVIRGWDEVHDKSRAIFVACEEDMDEALLAVKRGIQTFSSDWFMNCIMKQELDLEAPQFAESL